MTPRQQRKPPKKNIKTKLKSKSLRGQKFKTTHTSVLSSPRRSQRSSKRHPHIEVVRYGRQPAPLRSMSGAQGTYSTKKDANRRRQLLVGLMLTVVIVLFAASQFIARVEVIGDARMESALTLSKVSENYIAKHRWYLLFEKSDFIKMTERQASSVIVTDVTFQPTAQTLLVTSQQRHAAAIWQTNGSEYFIDQNAKVFTNPNQKKQPSITIRDTKNVAVIPGKHASNERFITFVVEANRMLSDNGLAVDRYEFGDDPRSLDILLTEPQLSLKMATTEKAQPQIDDVLLALKAFKEQGKTPAHYLDVRTPGKVFWQ